MRFGEWAGNSCLSLYVFRNTSMTSTVQCAMHLSAGLVFTGSPTKGIGLSVSPSDTRLGGLSSS